MTDETEDEYANEEYIEETNKDAVLLAAAKLVINNAVSRVSFLDLIGWAFYHHYIWIYELIGVFKSTYFGKTVYASMRMWYIWKNMLKISDYIDSNENVSCMHIDI